MEKHMNTDRLMALLNKKKSEKNARKFLKAPKGSSRYVLLPGWNPAEPEVFWHDYGEHWCKDVTKRNPQGNASIVARVVCNERTYHTYCPVCECLREAIGQCTSDEQKDALNSNFKAAQLYLMNVLALDSENPNVPQVLAVGSRTFDAIIDMVGQWSAQLFDPKQAQTFTITRAGEGLGTTYTVTINPTTYTIPEGTLDHLINLDEFCAPSADLEVTKGIGCFRALGVNTQPMLDNYKAQALPSPPKTATAPQPVSQPVQQAQPIPQTAPQNNVVQQVAKPQTIAQPTQTVAQAAPVAPVAQATTAVAATAIDTELDSLLSDLNGEAQGTAVFNEDDIPF